MLTRRRSQPAHSAGACAAAGLRPSSTSTRFFSSSTCFSSALRRASLSCAAAMLQAAARTSAASALERVAQTSRDAFRVSAAGGGRGADAVLAEIAQAAGPVVHLDVFADEVQVAVEEVLVRQ